MSIPNRKYQPIWEQIKSSGYCEISAHPAYHRRIIKAIWKEKTQDLEYKMQCLETYPPIRTLNFTSISGSVIKFTLIKKPLITTDTI